MRPLFGCNQYIPSEALGKAVLISWQLLPFLNKKSTFIYFFSRSERQCTHDRNCDYHSPGKIKVHKQLNSYQSILATAIGLGRQSEADPGFFLGGGALVSCSTSTVINHNFFLQNTSCIRKPKVMSGGGGAHPLHPPPRSAPGQCCMIAGWRNSLTAFSLLAKCKGIRDLGKLSW